MHFTPSRERRESRWALPVSCATHDANDYTDAIVTLVVQGRSMSAQDRKWLRLAAALLVIGALVFALVLPMSATWTRHTTADGACSVEFPETPRHETRTQDGDTVNALEVVLKDSNAHFALSYSDLSTTDGALPADELFSLLRFKFSSSTKTPPGVLTRVVKEQVLEERGFQGREFQFAVGDQFVTRIKVFVSGRRVYRAIAVNSPGESADRDAQRFIDSFRFEISKP